MVDASNTEKSRASEPAGTQDPLHAAREAFLCLLADAARFDEEHDGDVDSHGRPVSSLTYHITTDYRQLLDLCEALGIRVGYEETPGDAITREIDRAVLANMQVTGSAGSLPATGEALLASPPAIATDPVSPQNITEG